jgi:hypothetical protein
MKINALPKYDASDNSTGCCPRFNPDGWDGRELHFKDKLFVKAVTKSVNHVPVDMGQVFQRTFEAIEKAGAHDPDEFVVLSRDVSDVEGEHFFSVSKPVSGQEVVKWSGDYRTKLFEGPYENAPEWQRQFQAELASQDTKSKKMYYFYTTCPKCAEAYGKNYVVGVAELSNQNNED